MASQISPNSQQTLTSSVFNQSYPNCNLSADLENKIQSFITDSNIINTNGILDFKTIT